MNSRVYASPYNAVEIFEDTRRKKAPLDMHWGTFALTSEPVEEIPMKPSYSQRLWTAACSISFQAA